MIIPLFPAYEKPPDFEKPRRLFMESRRMGQSAPQAAGPRLFESRGLPADKKARMTKSEISICTCCLKRSGIKVLFLKHTEISKL
jgi:hypothetical protein